MRRGRTVELNIGAEAAVGSGAARVELDEPTAAGGEALTGQLGVAGLHLARTCTLPV